MHKTLFALFLLLITPGVHGDEQNLMVGDFSEEALAGKMPEHWQSLAFDGIDRHTVYSHIKEKNKGAIQANSSNSSSGLVRKIVINPEHFPIVSWQWKIQDIINTADLSQKKGDDAPARVYISFAYNSQQVSWWEEVKFEAIKFFYGEYPPITALTYVWASQTPQGAIINSPYTKRVKIIVLQSGAEQKQKWLFEQRNIIADYRLAFGAKEVPVISGVAIMTDTDNTGEQAMAWYGDIIFSK